MNEEAHVIDSIINSVHYMRTNKKLSKYLRKYKFQNKVKCQ